MDKSSLIIIIDNNQDKLSDCIESIQNQTVNCDYKIIKNNYGYSELVDIVKEYTDSYIVFIYSSDSIGIDYIRKITNRAAFSHSDIVLSECIEKMDNELYYPNRTFNQIPLDLSGKEIYELYTKQKELDKSWGNIWGKLYDGQLLYKSLIETADIIDAMDIIYRNAKRLTSIQHDYYIRQSSHIEEDYFKERYIKIETTLRYEEIKRSIADAHTQVISFDIFDTLVVRPFLYPSDLFIVLEQYTDEIIDTIDGVGFKHLRIEAERRARQRKKEISTDEQDITLDEIYETIGDMCKLLVPYLDKIKIKEKELEIQYCYTRETGKDLYELAIHLGKRVIFTSDMYLPESTIREILEKNGYKTEELYISCEYMKTKASGDLYDSVIQQVHVEPSTIVHIGDNYDTDVVNAEAHGIKAYHLPRTEELFNNWNPHIYTGSYFKEMFESQCGIVQNYDAKELLGIRCMMAVAMNKLYDYPYVFYARESDFNGNPYTIGYFTLGMHIYGVVKWLIDNTRTDKYDHIHFMARDGYTIKQAYDVLSTIYGINTKTYYTHMTRKSLMPLMFHTNMDCYNIKNNFNGVGMSPKVVLKILDPIIKSCGLEEKEQLCNDIGMGYEDPIASDENFLILSEMIAEKLYDQNKVDSFKKSFRECFDEKFTGKVGTFDMGYSGRVESVLKNGLGYDVTANYIHTCLDKAYQREIKTGVRINCFYDFTPFISGIAREMMMSEPTASCIGYGFENGSAIPLYGVDDTMPGTYYAVHYMQQAALQYVNDMVRIFGKYNEKLLIRNYYASIPFDYFLGSSKPYDRSIFSQTIFEDDMGLGRDISFEKFWDDMIHRIPETKINYNAFGRMRGAIIAFFAGDLGELKRRGKSKLASHNLLYNIAKKSYKAVKKLYHVIKRR